jgi:DNA-binding LacI/PurR family transcriptional regulator
MTSPLARGRKPVTIHDVARAASVSITTVSHAINGKGTVAEETRARVLETASRLGYQADALAKGMRNSRIGVIGLVMRPLDSLGEYRLEGVDYFTRLAGAAAVEALDRGYCLMLIRDLATGTAPAIAFAVDGYIVSDPVANDPVIDLLNQRGIPVVTVGRDIGRPDFLDWVGADESVEVQMVMEHLRGQGAHQIALLTGTDRNAWNLDTETRYRSWAGDNGMKPQVLREDEASGELGGRRAARMMLDGAGNLPDAVYCLTGRHAAGLVDEFTASGVRIPQDMKIVAGSDSEQTRNSTPPTTSVDLRPSQVARAAIELIHERLSGSMAAGPRPIESLLVVRGSTVAGSVAGSVD